MGEVSEHQAICLVSTLEFMLQVVKVVIRFDTNKMEISYTLAHIVYDVMYIRAAVHIHNFNFSILNT